MFEIEFDINFDHEEMGPPPPLRLSLLLFSLSPSDIFVLVLPSRRPRGGGAEPPQTLWRLERASFSYQSYAIQSCVIAGKKNQVASEV